MTTFDRTYYRVVAFGHIQSRATHTTPDAAWDAWERAVDRDGTYTNFDQACDACRAGLVAGTTRAAVRDADVSRSRGRCGKGEWWSVARGGK